MQPISVGRPLTLKKESGDSALVPTPVACLLSPAPVYCAPSRAHVVGNSSPFTPTYILGSIEAHGTDVELGYGGSVAGSMERRPVWRPRQAEPAGIRGSEASSLNTQQGRPAAQLPATGTPSLPPMASQRCSAPAAQKAKASQLQSWQQSSAQSCTVLWPLAIGVRR